MSDWKTYKLGEVGKIITGKTPPTKDPDNFGAAYPFITPRDMNTQKYIRKTERYLSEKGKLLLKNNVIPEHSICVSCIGSDLGKVVMTSESSITNQQLNSIICTERFDPDFIYYSNVLLSDIIRSIGKSSTAVPIVNKSQFSEFEIQAPEDKDEQKQIAQILSSLDDKIELNLQMNQTLESMAQAIFKEWFVDFNFPGFDGELVDGLPKGWRMGKVKDMYKTTSGGTPSRAKEEYYQNGTINWVKSKELNGSFIFETEEKITEDAVKNSSAKLIPKHSVLVAMYGATVGEYAITTRETTCNQAICAVIEVGAYSYAYFFEYFKINKNNIIGQAIGSAQQNISQALIQQLEILIPPIEVVKKYHLVVESMLVKMESNLLQIQALTQTRDTLLPMLMSGQLEVI